jgi:hypothetical protein
MKKRSELEHKALELIIKKGEDGVMQSDLWRELDTSSREGSRISLKLTKSGLIRREKRLHKGRWTYHLTSNREPIDIKSILDIPCITCLEIVKCEEDGPVSPNFCDDLTFWLDTLIDVNVSIEFLKENIEYILSELEESKPEECTFYYRPLFGKEWNYGEFDAIIITPENAYLIGSKRDSNSNPSSKIRKSQTILHKILAWYQKNWKGGTDEEWNAFCDEHQEEFQDKFKGKSIPKIDSQGNETRLIKNLRIVLEDIGNRAIKDILIIYHKDGKPEIHLNDLNN